MKQYIVIFFLCAVALALVWKLIPGEKEVALMYMRDKEFIIALEAYEKQKASGDLSVDTVGTLSQLYLQNGDVESAISLLEEFVANHPDNIEARKKLGVYYQYAQRTDDYLRNLDALAKLDPKPEYLEELADIHNYNADYESQKEVLSRIVEQEEEDNPQAMIDLIYLQASTGKSAKALDNMRSFADEHPEHLDEDAIKLFFSLLVDNRQYDEAITRVRQWNEQGKGLRSLSYFAMVIARHVDSGKALEMLRPYQDRIEQYPDILMTVVSLQRERGDNDQTYAYLEKLFRENRLPVGLQPTLMDLALDYGNDGLFLDVLQQGQLESFPEESLMQLAALADNPRYPEIRVILQNKLSPEFIAQRPVLHTAIILGTDDKKGQREHIRQIHVKDLSLQQRSRLAALLSRHDYNAKTRELLSSLPANEVALDPFLPQLAMSYARADAVTEGRRFFAKVRENRISPNVTHAEIIMASAAGDQDTVTKWLASEGSNVPNGTLLDLYYITADAKQPQLALVLAKRVYERMPNDRAKLNLANAYIKAGAPEKALPVIEGMDNRELASVQDTYFYAMQETVMKKRLKGEALRQVRSNLSRILLARLYDPKISGERRKETVYALINLGNKEEVMPVVRKLANEEPHVWAEIYVDLALKRGERQQAKEYILSTLERNRFTPKQKGPFISLLIEEGETEAALPHLKEMAYALGDNWVFAYEEALQKLGRDGDIAAIWRHRATAKNLSAKERRTIAFKLADYGDREQAAKILLPVAKASGPDSADIRQLLYLYDEKPPASVINWMESKARSSIGLTQAQWIERLVQVGAGERAIAVIDSEHPDERSMELELIYVKALLETRDYDRMEPLVATQIGTLDPAEQYDELLFLANSARDAGMNQLARQGYEALVDTGIYNPLLLRELGNVTYFEGNYEAARYYYEHYQSFLPLDEPLNDEQLDQAPLTLTPGFMVENTQENSSEQQVGQGDSVTLQEPDLSSLGNEDYIVDLRLGLIYDKLGKPFSASKHLHASLDAIKALPTQDRNSRLAAAKAYKYLGNDEEAERRYAALYRDYPKDREVAADYIELKMAQDDLEAARTLMDQSLAGGSGPQSLLVLASAKPDSAELSSTARLEILNGELLLKEGNVQASLAQYQRLEQSYPDNVYPLIGQAFIEDYIGRWTLALKKLDEALLVSPNNIDLQRARREVVNEHRSSITAGAEWRDVEEAEEGYTATIRGQVLRDNYDKMGIIVEHTDISIDEIVTADGVSRTDVDDSATMGEVFYEHQLDNGDAVRASLIGSGSGPGASLAYRMPGDIGVTGFLVEYHRPFWVLPQGVIADAARDRVEIAQTLRMRSNIFGEAFANLNRYTIDTDDEVAQSFGFGASLGYRIPGIEPVTAVIYNIDAEYLFDEAEQRLDAFGNLFRPLPHVSREVHSLALNFSDTYWNTFFWEFFVGYAIDRLGGEGAFVGGKAAYDITDDLTAEARASSAYNSNGLGGRVNRAGGYVTMRF